MDKKNSPPIFEENTKNNQELENFLEKIGFIESSSGRNIKHKLIKTGVQKGTRAIGTWGLMPNTVKELIERKKIDKSADNQDLFLDSLDTPQLYSFISSNPQVEKKYAKQLAQYVLERAGGNAEKAAYMWNMGHNLSPNKITANELNSSDYVKKFRRLGGGAPSRATASSTADVRSSTMDDKDLNELFDFSIEHGSDPSHLFEGNFESLPTGKKPTVFEPSSKKIQAEEKTQPSQIDKIKPVQPVNQPFELPKEMSYSHKTLTDNVENIKNLIKNSLQQGIDPTSRLNKPVQPEDENPYSLLNRFKT